jgi:hypothetical protein
MHDAELLIPIALFAMVFGIFYIRSRENMALIERGINPRANWPKSRPATAMRYGLILLGAGMGLIIAYLLDVYTLPRTYMEAGVQIHRDNEPIYFGLVGVGGGLGLVIAYLIERKAYDRTTPPTSQSYTETTKEVD